MVIKVMLIQKGILNTHQNYYKGTGKTLLSVVVVVVLKEVGSNLDFSMEEMVPKYISCISVVTCD